MNGVAAGAGEARGPRARPGFHGRLLATGVRPGAFRPAADRGGAAARDARARRCSPRSAWDSSSSTS